MSGSSSPLLLAALGGNQQVDPAVAALAPRLTLAQSLIQQGTSDAPTVRGGILSRLAQALAGGYLNYTAQSDLKDQMAQRQAETAGALASMSNPGGLGGSAVAPSPVAPTSTAPTGDFAGRLGASEGGSNPGAVNSSGHSGQFQFSAGRLADPAVGVYQPAPGEDLKANQWKGTFNIPGFTNVKTHSDFLANPDAQRAVFGTHIADIDNTISQIPGAANYNQNGLRAVAHLGGNEGMRKFVESGGQYDPADANGTHLSDYYKKFGGDAQPPGSVQVAGPGAPSAPGTSPPQGAQPPAPSATPATGMNAPNVQRGMAMMQEAQRQAVLHPYNPAIQHAAAMQMQIAQQIMQTDTFTDIPGGGQRNVRNNQIVYPPAGRFGTGPHGDMFLTSPTGGAPTIVAPNPTGLAGTNPEVQIMRTMIELGPKVSGGTATPEQIAAYNTAANTYQGFKTATNPVDQSLIRVPTQPLPPGMPAPGGGPTQPGGVGMSGVTPLTGGGRGPALAGDMEKTQSANDAKAISEAQAEVAKSHDLFNTTQTIRSLAPQVASGVGADQRLRAAQIFQTLGVAPETAKAWLGTDAPAGEILQKKLFELSTGATRAMGAREPGSVMQMFQKNYPNLTSQGMTIDAMSRLLDMDQKYKEDEVGGRQQHYQGQIAAVNSGQPYGGLSGYQQPDPRVYQAAALAAGGMPHSVWTTGLTPQQQVQALKLGASVYPDMTALDAKNVPHRFQAPQ